MLSLGFCYRRTSIPLHLVQTATSEEYRAKKLHPAGPLTFDFARRDLNRRKSKQGNQCGGSRGGRRRLRFRQISLLVARRDEENPSLLHPVEVIETCSLILLDDCPGRLIPPNLPLMKTWPVIPTDVFEHVRAIFAHANIETSNLMMDVPNSRETSLDEKLVQSLTSHGAPTKLISGAILRLDVHSIGGLRRLHAWETADIAMIVLVYDGDKLIARKIGLLQSKRLYPENKDVDDEDPEGFRYGMNYFLRPEFSSPLNRLYTEFHFHRDCRYAQLRANTDQVNRIDAHNAAAGEQIYYLFYNPPALPSVVTYPKEGKESAKRVSVGCRVYSVRDVHTCLSSFKGQTSPTIDQLEQTNSSNWSLEHWVADLLLTCKVGAIFDQSDEHTIANLLERRSGPIGAAIAISITLPEND